MTDSHTIDEPDEPPDPDDVAFIEDEKTEAMMEAMRLILDQSSRKP